VSISPIPQKRLALLSPARIIVKGKAVEETQQLEKKTPAGKVADGGI
jgi:hypothetical protein